MVESHRVLLRSALVGADVEVCARIGDVLARLATAQESGLAASILTDVADELRLPKQERDLFEAMFA